MFKYFSYSLSFSFNTDICSRNQLKEWFVLDRELDEKIDTSYISVGWMWAYS